MAKCNGNCAVCTLQASDNKQACCSVQTLKNIIEIKAMMKEFSSSKINFSSIEPIDDTEPKALGAEDKTE